MTRITLTGRNFRSKLKESYKDFDGEAINSYVKGWLNHTDGNFETISDLLNDLNSYLFEGLSNVVVMEAESYSNQGWVTPNIQRAYFTEDGRIWVEIGADQILEDFEICKDEGFNFTKDNDLIQFCKELGSVVVHEMVHLYQFTKHQDRSTANTSSDYFEYLMSKDEIDAHAISAVEEARSLGYTDKDILRKLSHSAKDLILELDSITPYVDFYGSDYKNDQDVIKRLLKKMTDYVLNSKMNEKEISKMTGLRERDEYQRDIDDYMDDLLNVLERDYGYERESITQNPDSSIVIDTDVGCFEITYVPGEWVYVLQFSGENNEFTKYIEFTDVAAEFIAKTLKGLTVQKVSEYELDNVNLNRRNLKEDSFDDKLQRGGSKLADKIMDILETKYDLVSTKENGRNVVHVETDVGNFEVLCYSEGICALRVDSESFNFEKEYDNPQKVCKVINDLVDAETEPYLKESVEAPKKSFKGFLNSEYCDIDKSDFEEFAQFLADECNIYEEDYKKLRSLVEWQAYAEDFKDFKMENEDELF